MAQKSDSVRKKIGEWQHEKKKKLAEKRLKNYQPQTIFKKGTCFSHMAEIFLSFNSAPN